MLWFFWGPEGFEECLAFGRPAAGVVAVNGVEMGGGAKAEFKGEPFFKSGDEFRGGWFRDKIGG